MDSNSSKIARVSQAASLPLPIVSLVLPVIHKTWVGLYWEQAQRILVHKSVHGSLGNDSTEPTTNLTLVQETAASIYNQHVVDSELGINRRGINL